MFITTHRRDDALTLALPNDDSLLAMLLTARAERLVERWVDFWMPLIAAAAARGEIRRGLDHRRAAEWIVRMLLSIALMPSVVIDTDDPEQVRDFVQEHIVHCLAPTRRS